MGRYLSPRPATGVLAGGGQAGVRHVDNLLNQIGGSAYCLQDVQVAIHKSKYAEKSVVRIKCSIIYWDFNFHCYTLRYFEVCV